MENKKGTYWYEIYIEECVYCGKIYEYRLRVYCKDKPKPENKADQYHYKQYVCGYHFA